MRFVPAVGISDVLGLARLSYGRYVMSGLVELSFVAPESRQSRQVFPRWETSRFVPRWLAVAVMLSHVLICLVVFSSDMAVMVGPVRLGLVVPGCRFGSAVMTGSVALCCGWPWPFSFDMSRLEMLSCVGAVGVRLDQSG